MPAPGWQDQIVARPDGGSGEENVHAAWRLAVAEQAARAYASNDKLAALAAAGSVGAGLADRFSDLELDCYWFDPPDDLDRSGPVHLLGGDLEALWDYDSDEEEWSDEYRLGDLAVTVSSFLVSTIDRFVDDVVLRTDTDPVKHMRMAALHRSRSLHGPELKADGFGGPDPLKDLRGLPEVSFGLVYAAYGQMAGAQASRRS